MQDGAADAAEVTGSDIMKTVWTHIFRWGNNPKRKRLQGRKCRVISKGTMKSCLVEFDGGQREIVSVRSLRKRSELEIRGDGR